MLEAQRTSDRMEPRYIETIKRILQLNEWFSLQCYYTMCAIRPQYFWSLLVHRTSWDHGRAVFCEDVRKRRSVTSRYHSSKISRSQLSCLIETAICIVERWKKSLGYRFASECNHAQERHTCHCCPPYVRNHGLLRSRHSATMATWCNDFSALLRFCNREFKLRRLRTTNYGWTSVVLCL